MKTYTGRKSDGKCVSVSVENNKISAVETLPDTPGMPWILSPLVDLQQNGALGLWFNAIAKSGTEALTEIAQYLRRHGVGRCLATTTTVPETQLRQSGKVTDALLSKNPDLEKIFFGFFHEGIFISPLDGWRGAHDVRYVRPPDWDSFRRTDDAFGGRFKVINIAPEEAGGLEFIDKAVASGRKISLGHCGPDAVVIDEAVKRGASMVTHFGNGAPPLIPRFKNPFWSYLSHPELLMGVICDGFHLPPEVVAAAFTAKGRANIYPISDASGESGCKPGLYKPEIGPAYVIEPNGHIYLQENMALLNGAWFQQDRCVEFLVEKLAFTVVDAWLQCSTVPAAVIGLKLPEIAIGEDADFVLVRWENGLIIEQSVHNGREYLDSPLRTACS